MKLKIYKDEDDFFEVIKPVELGDIAEADFLFDFFDEISSDQEQQILKFCEKNPRFHIASQLNRDTCYNFYVPGSNGYYLCYGDRDASIVLFNEELAKDSLKSDLPELLEYYFPRKTLQRFKA